MARKYTLKGSPDPSGGPSSSLGSPGASKTPPAAPAGRKGSGLVNCGISERSRTLPPSPEAKNRFLKHVFEDAPVVGFRLMKNDVVTVRRARYPDELAARLEGSVRGVITDLSMESRRRLALVAGNTPVVFRSFVTVTYPAKFPCDGEVVKRHLHALLAGLRRKCRGVQYLWFLEFQKRGAPHVHLFLDVALPEPLSVMRRVSGRVRKDVRVHWPWQNWLSALWFGIVGSDDPKHLKAGAAWEVIEKPDGAARYVSKEAYKTFQKVVPKGFQNVGRFWGCSRGVPPDPGKEITCSLDQMRALFPAEHFGEQANPFPVLFGGAEVYRAIEGTAADPAKVNAWRRAKRGKTPDLMPIEETRPEVDKSDWHGSTSPS